MKRAPHRLKVRVATNSRTKPEPKSKTKPEPQSMKSVPFESKSNLHKSFSPTTEGFWKLRKKNWPVRSARKSIRYGLQKYNLVFE